MLGKLYLIDRDRLDDVPGWAEMGPDADDPTLTLDAFRVRIRRHPGELKNLLRNQKFVAGIGNAYSDEILWAARLAPLRKRSSLSPEEIAKKTSTDVETVRSCTDAWRAGRKDATEPKAAAQQAMPPGCAKVVGVP